MADNFTLKIITPERIFYEGPVTMVEFNTTEGEIGEFLASPIQK
jgi:F-type H+-transporting ATPase subunit epsilon